MYGCWLKWFGLHHHLKGEIGVSFCTQRSDPGQLLLGEEIHTRVGPLGGDGVTTPVWVSDSEVSRHGSSAEDSEEDGLKLHFY